MILIPTAALPPPFWALGCPPKLSYLASDFQISHGLILNPFSSLELRHRLPGQHIRRVIWLGTLSIHKGTSNSSSTLKMTLIMSSLSSLADHVLSKEPRTDSLSVNKTTRLDFRKLRQDFMAAKTAIISSSWMTVSCPLDSMSSSVSLSTAMPPRPQYFWRSKDAST